MMYPTSVRPRLPLPRVAAVTLALLATTAFAPNARAGAGAGAARISGVQERIGTVQNEGLTAGSRASDAVDAVEGSDSHAIADEALLAFQARHRAVVKLLRAKGKRNQLEAEIDGMLDYHALAVATLGGDRRYAETCGSRCPEFDALLAELIRRNYHRILSRAQGSPIEYTGRSHSKRTGNVKIKTKVKVTKPGTKHRRTLRITYVVHRTSDGRWMVSDIVTEGASLKRIYRTEFGKIRKKKAPEGGIDGIIDSLRSKIAELKAKDGSRAAKG